MINFLKQLLYQLNGKKPWTRGYIASRTDFLIKILNRDIFEVPNLKKKYGQGFDERVVEYPWLFSRLSKNRARLLDAGSVLNFDYILNHPHLKDKTITISTLAPEQNCFWFKNISYVFEDFRQSCFKDNYFDEIVCLSTLEHVGLDNKRYFEETEYKIQSNAVKKFLSEPQGNFLQAITELKRILKPGGKLYLSMPFGKQKNHGWFQVFDAVMVDQIYSTFSATSPKEWIFLYTADGWKLSSREGSKNSIYLDRHTTSSKVMKSLAAAEAVICIELTKDL